MSTRFRKFIVIGASLALLVGVTAGPLAAASSNKTYTVAASPASLPYSSTGTAQGSLAIVFTNTTPSASINSLTVAAPSGWTISTAAPITVTESSGNAGNYSAILDSGTNTITVTNLSPVSYLGTVSVSFTASTSWNGALSCTGNGAAWTTTAWTGSKPGSGNQFTLSGPAATTSVGTNLAVGATITVSGVSLTNNGTTCVPVTISRNGNSVTILKPTASTDMFRLDVLWDPEPAALPLKVDSVTIANGSTNPIQWCGGTVSSLTMPLGQVSCLVSETAKVYGPDANNNPQIQVEDVVNLIGDYSISRD